MTTDVPFWLFPLVLCSGSALLLIRIIESSSNRSFLLKSRLQKRPKLRGYGK